MNATAITPKAVRPLWERTKVFRAYSSWLIPGAVQTAAYTTAVLKAIAARRNLHDDTEEAAAVRADRLRLLREGDHRFSIVIEESVLRTVIGDAQEARKHRGLTAVGAAPPEARQDRIRPPAGVLGHP